MNNAILPEITKNQIDNTKQDTWDFLFLFLDHYLEELYTDESGEVMNRLNDDQHTLIAYNFLYNQITNGGFLQLIQNGYASYIFDNPFSEHIKLWGAHSTAEIVEKARTIYEQNKEQLSKETTLEEFSKMYDEFQEFEPLDNKFYDVMDAETEVVRQYVENNISKFGKVI